MGDGSPCTVSETLKARLQLLDLVGAGLLKKSVKKFFGNTGADLLQGRQSRILIQTGYRGMSKLSCSGGDIGE